MILRLEDGTSFETDNEDIAEREVWNANFSTTIGGRVKSQADSSRLQIDVETILPNTQYVTLKAIIESFGQELYYTPGRVLFGRSSIEEIKVIAKSPQIKSRVGGTCAVSGQPGFIFSVRLEEVID